MSFLFWTATGFIGGVIISKNGEHMNSPSIVAIFLAMIIGCGFMWWAGYHGKNVAVATATATATAIANANANAKAAAIASSAINLYLGAQAGATPEMIGSIVDRSVIENTNNTKNLTAAYDSSFGERETA